MKRAILILLPILSLQLQAADPMKVLRDKGFYKTGAAAKNTSFVEWLRKPVFGEESSQGDSGNADSASGESGGALFGLLHSRPVRRNDALELIRDEGYKEKEAKMRAEWEAKRRASEKNDPKNGEQK
jgi:hypothetical protein